MVQFPYPKTKKRNKRTFFCRCNDFRFNRWLDSTSIHGIAHVFHGKSTCRRIFWAIIFLIALGVCLFEVVDRVRFFFSHPTSTTTTFESQKDSLADFPAVTFCNLNPVKRTFADEHNLSTILDLVFHPSKLEFLTGNFSATCADSLSHLAEETHSMPLSGIIYDQENAGSFIVQCNFGSNSESGDYYNCTDQFVQEPTSLGLCYTFNSHLASSDSKTVHSSGEMHGLRVLLNINQEEYSTSLNGNAGIKLSINKFGDIPDLNEKGILVPPGMNAYIGLKSNKLIDETRGRPCEGSNRSFEYYHSAQQYSTGVCKASAFAKDIDEACDCLHYRTTTNPNHSRNCSVNDVCCLTKTRLKHSSNCPAPCDTITYTAQTSYAQFPSTAFADELSQILNLSVETVYRDIVAVNIYFEDTGVTVTKTTNTYKSADFLSDLGGTMGLFLGASVISMLELVLLVFDEIKDRTWKKSWKRKLSVIDQSVLDGYFPEVTGEKDDNEEQEEGIENISPDDNDESAV